MHCNSIVCMLDSACGAFPSFRVNKTVLQSNRSSVVSTFAYRKSVAVILGPEEFPTCVSRNCCFEEVCMTVLCTDFLLCLINS